MKMALLLIAASMTGQTFTVVNKMPVEPTVKKVATYQKTTVTTYRAATGHTHTCVNGHVWDHTLNATHRCQVCGATQYTVDRVPRPVPVTRTVRVLIDPVSDPSPVAVAAPAATPRPPKPVRFATSSGGCANGACQYAR